MDTGRTVQERLAALKTGLAALAAQAGPADAETRARLEAAMLALEGRSPGARNTAVLESLSEVRSTVRDIVSEELARYWERRFGGRP